LGSRAELTAAFAGFFFIASKMGEVGAVFRSPSVIFFFLRQVDQRRKAIELAALAALSVCVAVGLGGCSRLRSKPAAEYVYVTAKQTFLRDRVAAVSNRTATVDNGDRLQVLEHGRRYVRVETAKGEQGWIDEKAVATQSIFDQFKALQRSIRRIRRWPPVSCAMKCICISSRAAIQKSFTG
jgi:hypothetical protein